MNDEHIIPILATLLLISIGSNVALQYEIDNLKTDMAKQELSNEYFEYKIIDEKADAYLIEIYEVQYSIENDPSTENLYIQQLKLDHIRDWSEYWLGGHYNASLEVVNTTDNTTDHTYLLGSE